MREKRTPTTINIDVCEQIQMPCTQMATILEYVPTPAHLEISDRLTSNSSLRTSLTGSETIINAAPPLDRLAFRHSTFDHFYQTNLLCSICTRLPKAASHFFSNRLNRIPISLPRAPTVSKFTNCRSEILLFFPFFIKNSKEMIDSLSSDEHTFA